MNPMNRLPARWWLLSGAVTTVLGYALQVWRSQRGLPPLVPPISLSASLLVLALVLVVLGVLLRRAVRDEAARPVNPFHAVRLLAGARAAQLVGALFAGLGVGLLLQVLTRSVVPSAASWAPMLSLLLAGVVCTVCGIIVESLCRVPPESGDTSDQPPRTSSAGEARGELGAAPRNDPSLPSRNFGD